MRFLQTGLNTLFKIASLMAGQIPARLQNTSVSAIVVRHPLSKLVSGYRYLLFLVLHYDSYGLSLLRLFICKIGWDAVPHTLLYKQTITDIPPLTTNYLLLKTLLFLDVCKKKTCKCILWPNNTSYHSVRKYGQFHREWSGGICGAGLWEPTEFVIISLTARNCIVTQSK